MRSRAWHYAEFIISDCVDIRPDKDVEIKAVSYRG